MDDDLLATLETSFQVTSFPNNPHAPHPRFSQYKIRNKTSYQDERRKQLLEQQKKNRYDYVNYIRNLIENVSCDTQEEDDGMDWQSSAKHIKKRPAKTFKNQLMLSEWLVDIPEDFETQWYFVPCPEGKRSLVVAANGRTKCYSKGGYCIKSFPSSLPGGSKHFYDHKSKNYTMLDCIFNEEERTYYVLDVLCWGGHPVLDSETEFRFYWLKAKLEETPSAQEHLPHNPYRFLSVPYYQCTLERLVIVMWTQLPFTPKLDGLLFYHKQTCYVHGPTPLVGWLKAYMLPEMFSGKVTVPDAYLAEKPEKYTCLSEHLKVSFSKKNKTKEKPMEIAASGDG